MSCGRSWVRLSLNENRKSTWNVLPRQKPVNFFTRLGVYLLAVLGTAGFWVDRFLYDREKPNFLPTPFLRPQMKSRSPSTPAWTCSFSDCLPHFLDCFPSTGQGRFLGSGTQQAPDRCASQELRSHGVLQTGLTMQDWDSWSETWLGRRMAEAGVVGTVNPSILRFCISHGVCCLFLGLPETSGWGGAWSITWALCVVYPIIRDCAEAVGLRHHRVHHLRYALIITSYESSHSPHFTHRTKERKIKKPI